MRIPRVRFSIRFLMIAVVGAGVFLTAGRLVYLRRHYHVRAALHARKVVDYVRQAQAAERRQEWCARQAAIANLVSASDRGSTWERLATASGATAHGLRRLAAHESQLKCRYERAAIRPWFLVEPDPPAPER